MGGARENDDAAMMMTGPAALVLALLMASPAAAQERGVIRICRDGSHGLNDHRVLTVPAGTIFVNGNGKDGELKPYFTIRTTADVALPLYPRCVVAPAEMAENPQHFAPTTRYPAPMPSQFDVPGVGIFGWVLKDFR